MVVIPAFRVGGDRGDTGILKLICDNPLRHKGDTVRGSSGIIFCMQGGCVVNKSEHTAGVGSPASALPVEKCFSCAA